jgi:hypothetical protein
MNENMDMDFGDFFSGFEGDEYQADTAEHADSTETAEETAETEETSDTAQEVEEGSEGAETAEDESNQEAEKDGAQEHAEAEKAEEKRTFENLKVNGEIRSCTYEEAPAWIQKGMDYDRVKGQLEASRKTEQELRTQLDSQREIMEILNLISEQNNTPLKDLGDQLYVNFQRANGKTETEARQNLENARLKKENEALKNQHNQKQSAVDDVSDRVQREVSEFRKHFPDVQLTEELCNSLTPDIQSGMSLTNAYLKHENARKDSEKAELEQKLAAMEQNKKNRSKTPSSQRDSGGQRSKDAMEDFFSAFEK